MWFMKFQVYFLVISCEQCSKPLYHSIESWLVYRDSPFSDYHNPQWLLGGLIPELIITFVRSLFPTCLATSAQAEECEKPGVERKGRSPSQCCTGLRPACPPCVGINRRLQPSEVPTGRRVAMQEVVNPAGWNKRRPQRAINEMPLYNRHNPVPSTIAYGLVGCPYMRRCRAVREPFSN